MKQDQGDQVDFLDFFYLDFNFEYIFRFCNISVLVTFQFCNNLVLVKFQFWSHFSFGDISVLVIF